MDRKTYEFFYAYGASAFAEEPKEFHEYRYRLFQDFLDANSMVVPHNYGEVCCETQLLIGGRQRCHTSRSYCGQDFRHDIYDHKHAMRLKGVRKSIFVATHPYNYRKHVKSGLKVCDYSDMPSKILKGLVANVYPKGKSWYYPDGSNLCIIVPERELVSLDLSVLGEPIDVFVGTLER